MTYFAIVLTVVVIAILNVALMVYAYMRVKDRKPLVRDQVIGFLLAGPFFFFIDRGLRKRDHKLTPLEYYGLLAVALIILVLIVGSIATNFTNYPS
jgi:uncharacterized BrkB/YihY/UPF0761 family membrane protein